MRATSARKRLAKTLGRCESNRKYSEFLRSWWVVVAPRMRHNHTCKMEFEAVVPHGGGFALSLAAKFSYARVRGFQLVDVPSSRRFTVRSLCFRFSSHRFVSCLSSVVGNNSIELSWQRHSCCLCNSSLLQYWRSKVRRTNSVKTGRQQRRVETGNWAEI